MPNYKGWAVVAGHGYDDGRIEMEGVVAQPRDLYDRLVEAGYKNGTPVLLLNCNAARGDFPAGLAELTKGAVYAAGGFVRIPRNEGERTGFTYESFTERDRKGERSGWVPFGRNGIMAGRGIDSIRVSNDGKTMSIRFDAATGTRIRGQVKVDIDDKNEAKRQPEKAECRN